METIERQGHSVKWLITNLLDLTYNPFSHIGIRVKETTTNWLNLVNKMILSATKHQHTQEANKCSIQNFILLQQSVSSNEPIDAK